MEDGAEMGAKEVEGVLRGDVGHVMRRRAEDGYGLDNVSWFVRDVVLINVQLLLNAAIATCYPGQERLKGIWEFIDRAWPTITHLVLILADLTRVMDPITSKAGGYDLTNAGAHPIWTGNGVQSDSDSPSSSTRSGSTLITELAPVQSTVRETVKQGSAAWSSLRNHPNQQPPISSLPSAPKGTVSEAADPGLTAAIQAINARRTDSHPGSPGTHQLPRTEREGARRMILALCGEMHEGAGIGEIHHSVFLAAERQTS